MRMRQETFKKSYYIPAFGKSIEIRRNQDIDEEGILGKELLAQYGEDCILEGETKSLMEKVASGNIGTNLLPDGLTAEQGKEAIEQAHLSKDALGKIEGMQSLGKEIDAVNNTYSIDTKITSTSSTIVIDSSGAVSTDRSTIFSGWGAIYNKVSGISWNAIQIPRISRGNVATNMKWRKIVLDIRDTSIKGTILATSTVYVNPNSNTLENLIFLLKDINGNLITFNDANTPSKYAIRYSAYNSDNTLCICSECEGNVINYAGNSYYGYQSNIDTWAAYAGNPPLAFKTLLLNAPIETNYITDVNGVNTENEKLILADNFYATTGVEVNIYFDNIIKGNASNYIFDIYTTANASKHQQERFTIYPTTAGTYTVKIDLYSSLYVLLDTKTISLIVTNKTTAKSGTYKALVIGDSLIDFGFITQELVAMQTADAVTKINLIGTRGTSPNLHEGRGGWKVEHYARSNALSPFLFSGVFNFSTYMTNNGFSSVDYVMFHLGINDIMGETTLLGVHAKMRQAIIDYKTMFDSIKLFNPSVKIFLLLPPPPSSSQDSFGANYSTGRDRISQKRAILEWNKLIIDYFKNTFYSNIYVIPTMNVLDTVNNVQKDSAIAVNSRNSTTTIARQNNGVHPAESGYYQMTDEIFSAIKAI